MIYRRFPAARSAYIGFAAGKFIAIALDYFKAKKQHRTNPVLLGLVRRRQPLSIFIITFCLKKCKGF